MTIPQVSTYRPTLRAQMQGFGQGAEPPPVQGSTKQGWSTMALLAVAFGTAGLAWMLAKQQRRGSA